MKVLQHVGNARTEMHSQFLYLLYEVRPGLELQGQHLLTEKNVVNLRPCLQSRLSETLPSFDLWLASGIMDGESRTHLDQTSGIPGIDSSRWRGIDCSIVCGDV